MQPTRLVLNHLLIFELLKVLSKGTATDFVDACGCTIEKVFFGDALASLLYTVMVALVGLVGLGPCFEKIFDSSRYSSSLCMISLSSPMRCKGTE